MSNKFDFSDINFQYLVRARDLAHQNPEIIAPLLGIPNGLALNLLEISPKELSCISRIRAPLLVPRAEAWWWERLLTAIRHGHLEEIDSILEHASQLSTLIPEEDR